MNEPEHQAAPIAAPQESVAWRFRGRDSINGEWGDWQHGAHQPQGPASETFQMQPLYTASAAPVPVLPEGWVMVPREPTQEMLDAAVKSRCGCAVHKCVSNVGIRTLEQEAADDYAAMIAAAPKQGEPE